MSSTERNEDDPVTEKLCQSRRETLISKIDGLRKEVMAYAGITMFLLGVVIYLIAG